MNEDLHARFKVEAESLPIGPPPRMSDPVAARRRRQARWAVLGSTAVVASLTGGYAALTLRGPDTEAPTAGDRVTESTDVSSTPESGPATSEEAPTTHQTVELAAVMEGHLRGVVGEPAKAAKVSFDASTPSEMSVKTVRSDEPAELNLALESGGRHWRLYYTDEQAQDTDPSATCASKVETGWYLSCEPQVIEGVRVVVSVAELSSGNFAAGDGPEKGMVRYDRSVFTVEGDGPVIAFHDVVDAAPTDDPSSLFVVSVGEAASLVSDPDLRDLK